MSSTNSIPFMDEDVDEEEEEEESGSGINAHLFNFRLAHRNRKSTTSATSVTSSTASRTKVVQTMVEVHPVPNDACMSSNSASAASSSSVKRNSSKKSILKQTSSFNRKCDPNPPALTSGSIKQQHTLIMTSTASEDAEDEGFSSSNRVVS